MFVLGPRVGKGALFKHTHTHTYCPHMTMGSSKFARTLYWLTLTRCGPYIASRTSSKDNKSPRRPSNMSLQELWAFKSQFSQPDPTQTHTHIHVHFPTVKGSEAHDPNRTSSQSFTLFSCLTLHPHKPLFPSFAFFFFYYADRWMCPCDFLTSLQHSLLNDPTQISKWPFQVTPFHCASCSTAACNWQNKCQSTGQLIDLMHHR